MYRTFFEGYGTFFHSSQRWSHKTHICRVAETGNGRYAIYDREGNLLGVARTMRGATNLLKAE